MKVALCYSGQIGGIYKAYNNQLHHTIIPNNCDIYCYTSDAVSQKGINITGLNVPNITPPIIYLKKGRGWWENYFNSYGIIYNIEKQFIDETFKKLYGERLKNYEVEKEIICGEDHDLIFEGKPLAKWDYLKKRQLHKMKRCNELLEQNKNEYDIIIRSRFEFVTNFKIDVEEILDKNGGLEKNRNTVFVFGGFNCTPPMVFMDEYYCDGYMFGTPEVINIACSLADKEKPYPPHPKYIENWKKWGDSVEHQFRSHMVANNIDIKYISNKRADYNNMR